MSIMVFQLGGSWRFELDLADIGEDKGWFGAGFNDDSWLSVDVPSNWDCYRPELFGYSGVGWYRRSFFLCEEWSKKRLVLKFEGVNYSAKVWVNGTLVGSHEGGFMPFEFDITDKVSFGEANLIAVKVENVPGKEKVPSSLGGWWNYGGIYRDVRIEAKEALHFDDVFISAQPVADEARLKLMFRVENKGSKAASLKIESNVTTAEGHVVLSSNQEPRLAVEVEIPPRAHKTSDVEIRAKGMKTWSPQNPNLYVLNSHLKTRDGTQLDATSTTFGVRSISVKDGRFHLNGKPVMIRGVNRHEEYPNSGRVDRENLLEEDLRMIRDDLAANMIRIHYLCDPKFYDTADRLGLLVFAEIPAWQISKEAMKNPKVVANMRQQLAELINKLKNHPSVVVWSVGNECESDNEIARSVIGGLIQFVKEMDSTRPVTYVSSYIYSDDGWCRCLDLGDFTSINAYFDVNIDKLNEVLERIHRENPGRSILLTEFGAEAVRGLHGEFAGSEEHQADVVEKTFNLMVSKDYMLGGIVWSFTDYWHQARRLGTAYLNPVCYLHGILNLDRRPKKSFGVLNKLFINTMDQ